MLPSYPAIRKHVFENQLEVVHSSQLKHQMGEREATVCKKQIKLPKLGLWENYYLRTSCEAKDI